jgi:uncharacterized UBP type Zn finger protein
MKFSQFCNTNQQCPADFMLSLIDSVQSLKDLTRLEMLVTYQCQVCQVITNSPTTEVFFMLPESIKGGNNTTEIYFNNRISHLEKDCQACKAKNSNHKQTQTMILRPKVLLLALKRFDNYDNKIFTDVKPCKSLQISHEAKYELKSVIEHHGNTSRSGHITSSLSVSNNWVKCNDTFINDFKMPTQGYIFLYELEEVAQNNEHELVLEAPPVRELPKKSTRELILLILFLIPH